MKGARIEILCIGPTQRLFQVRDHESFGLVEVDVKMDLQRPFEGIRLHHPEVEAYLRDWLERRGALVGSSQPPRIALSEICRHVPVACAGSVAADTPELTSTCLPGRGNQ